MCPILHKEESDLLMPTALVITSSGANAQQGFSDWPLTAIISIVVWTILEFIAENTSHVHHPHALLHSSSAGSPKTDQHFLFPVLSKTFYCTPCVTYYCFVQGAGRRLSSFKLSCNLFGIIPAVNSTGGTVQVVCSCHILISPSVQSISVASRWWCCERGEC